MDELAEDIPRYPFTFYNSPVRLPIGDISTRYRRQREVGRLTGLLQLYQRNPNGIVIPPETIQLIQQNIRDLSNEGAASINPLDMTGTGIRMKGRSIKIRGNFYKKV